MRVVEDLRTLDAGEWDRLLAASSKQATPFMRHAFLLALQETGCTGEATGWTQRFACLHDADGNLAAAAPLYVKAHSYGEYVFDWAWADAYHRHGLAYYPKGLVAVPFTPVPGPRLLARDDAARRALVAALQTTADEAELSSLHVLFPDEAGGRALEEAGWLRRRGLQFHWTNPGYADFESFLAALSQPKRKKIRAERRKVAEAGVRTRVLEGRDIDEAHWAFFSRCYRNTYAMHHSTPYLNKTFFLRIGEAMPENLVMVLAERDAQPVAASLLVRDATTIYGRYWGAEEHIACLHFEASYYTPLEWAISRGIACFEGGAQGEHKMARGFLPVQTNSYHRLAHPAFAEAVARFLAREAGGIDEYLDELTERAPLRRSAE